MKQDTVAPALQENFEDKLVLKNLNSIFAKKRGYSFKIPQKNSAVVLLLSGGLDSIGIWHLLLAKYRLKVYPLHIVDDTAGGKENQIKSIKHYSAIFKRQFPLHFQNPIFNKKEIFRLKNTRIILDPEVYLANLARMGRYDIKYQPLISPTPTRLYDYVFLAYEYILSLKLRNKINVDTIFVSFVPDDNRYSRETTLTALRAMNLFCCMVVGDWKWQITGPMEKDEGFYFTKADLIRFAVKNNLNLGNTWSCSLDLIRQCGMCYMCRRRRGVFRAINMIDPTPYLINEKILTLKDRLKHTFLEKKNTVISLLVSFLEKKSKTIDDEHMTKYRFYLSKNVRLTNYNNISYLILRHRSNIVPLNASGSTIWEHIREKRSFSFHNVLGVLKKQYPSVEKEVLIRDLKVFFRQLIAEEIITI